jgi:FtsH-binding integral membrane protein
MSLDPSRHDTSLYTLEGRTIDAGLQSHMRSVYNTMCVGLGITGLVAYAVATVPVLTHLILGTPLFFVAALAPLGFMLWGFSPTKMQTMPVSSLRSAFAWFSALMGLSLSALLVYYTQSSVAQAFFVTAAAFAGTSLYGYTTKRDLTAMGSFMFMGMIGIVFASLISLFFHAAAVQFAISVIGVIVFTGMAAWQTQFIKESYSDHPSMGDANDRMVVQGALSLYMNFINLFQFILSLIGDRR